jgi:hypothetical protein
MQLARAVLVQNVGLSPNMNGILMVESFQLSVPVRLHTKDDGCCQAASRLPMRSIVSLIPLKEKSCQHFFDPFLTSIVFLTLVGVSGLQILQHGSNLGSHGSIKLHREGCSLVLVGVVKLILTLTMKRKSLSFLRIV